MQKQQLLTLACVLLLQYIHATDFNKCAFVQCGDRCETCEVADETDQPKCVVSHECRRCEPDVAQVQCFVDPCHQWQSRCPQASECRSSYCGECTAHYYNANLDVINDCEQISLNLTKEETPSSDQVMFCSGQRVRRQPGETCNETTSVHFYDRMQHRCVPYSKCADHDTTNSTLPLNQFSTLDECDAACEGVRPCPAVAANAPKRPGCVIRWEKVMDRDSERYGCRVPRQVCSKTATSCGMENACLPCHTCVANDEGGYCCDKQTSCSTEQPAATDSAQSTEAA